MCKPWSLISLLLLTACSADKDDTACADDGVYRDGDGDGYIEEHEFDGCESVPADLAGRLGDCDDVDPDVHPEAEDVPGDGIDQDCDGLDATASGTEDSGGGDSGEDTGDEVTDSDHDGATDDLDCEPYDDDVFPDAVETCDGSDNDCDGETDEDAADASTWCADADGDGYGDGSVSVVACDAPSGYVADSSDIDDSMSSIFPGSDAVDDDGDGYSEDDGDCDDTDPAVTSATDGDGDGSTCGEDCDDADPGTYPGAWERCDGVDHDCDGLVSDDLEYQFVYLDADEDGYGDPDSVATACDLATGWVLDGSDCDDTDAATHPDAYELCDGQDNDCDGQIDEIDHLDPNSAAVAYPDLDGDGYGVAGEPTLVCPDAGGYSAVVGDCDDDDPLVYEGAAELCDGQDNDCDSDSDEDGGAAWFEEDGDYADLSEDLAMGTDTAPVELALSSAGTLYICSGTWYVHISTDNDLSVIGTDEDDTILDGAGLSRVITATGFSDLYVTGMTITGGDASCASPSGYGGGVYVAMGTATLESVTVKENRASYGGGLGTNSTGDANLRDVRFQDNYAGAAGGAVLVETATVREVTFDGNESLTSGGALLAARVEISDSTFQDNDSSQGGGAYLYDGTITGTTFDGNRASTWGGAIHQYDGTLTLTDTTLTDNSAGSGGAIITFASNLTLDTVTMTGNSASHGGALYSQSSGVLITGSSLTENAASFGGAIEGLYASTEVEDSDISENTASYGGAFFLDSYGGGPTTLTLGVGTTVSRNTASQCGGAITTSLAESAVGATEVYIEGASITDNQARYGGALASGYYYCSGLSKAVIDCSSGEVSGNTATMGLGNGASLYVGTGGSLTSDGCTWDADQEVYIVNTETSYAPSSSGTITCTSTGCI